MVGMMTQGAYYAVDRAFVGMALNPDALAGITLAFPYMLVLLAAAMLVGFGAAAQVSIKLGEKKKDEAEQGPRQRGAVALGLFRSSHGRGAGNVGPGLACPGDLGRRIPLHA